MDSENSTYFVGVDPGGNYSRFAYVICQQKASVYSEKSELHLIKIMQYPLKTDSFKILRDLKSLSTDHRFGHQAPIFILDDSGNGGKILHQLMQQREIKPIIPITIISRGRSTKGKVLKEDLTNSLLKTIKEGRLRVPPKLNSRQILFEEFEHYRSFSSPKNNTVQFRSTRGGTDDCIDALSLITYACEKSWAPRWTRERVGLSPGSMKQRPITNRPQLYTENMEESLYGKIHDDFADLRDWQ
jgi:hypothetical protein